MLAQPLASRRPIRRRGTALDRYPGIPSSSSMGIGSLGRERRGPERNDASAPAAWELHERCQATLGTCKCLSVSSLWMKRRPLPAVEPRSGRHSMLGTVQSTYRMRRGETGTGLGPAVDRAAYARGALGVPDLSDRVDVDGSRGLSRVRPRTRRGPSPAMSMSMEAVGRALGRPRDGRGQDDTVVVPAVSRSSRSRSMCCFTVRRSRASRRAVSW